MENNDIHFTHFAPPQKWEGNERVKVKTKNGYTYVSRYVAEEEGYEIVPQKRNKRRTSAEVNNGL